MGDDVVDVRGEGNRPALAVVTGASSGIGRALADVLADEGFRLLIASESERIHDAADELSAGGADVVPVQADLATSSGVDELAAAIADAGGAQVLCANAGIGLGGAFVESDLAAELRVVDLDVRGVVQLCGLVIPDMVRRSEGAVLLTSSVAASMPGPGYATYAASKAFVKSFAEALHVELDETGVSVTALEPGPTDTAFFERAGLQNTRLEQGHKDDPERVAEDAVEALLTGDDHVVAGSFRNKVETVIARFLPQSTAAGLQGRMLEGSSAQPDD